MLRSRRSWTSARFRRAASIHNSGVKRWSAGCRRQPEVRIDGSPPSAAFVSLEATARTSRFGTRHFERTRTIWKQTPSRTPCVRCSHRRRRRPRRWSVRKPSGGAAIGGSYRMQRPCSTASRSGTSCTTVRFARTSPRPESALRTRARSATTCSHERRSGTQQQPVGLVRVERATAGAQEAFGMHGGVVPIEPYDSGTIDVGDGHHVYWECCGNPAGEPALFLHGGPGSGCSPGSRRYFDPTRYRAVLFDQRGCGRSRPLASALDADLRSNTTAHLIADIERLRRHLAIDTWTVLGMSWGTTLGLAYAQAHPEHVDALILALVTTTSRREVEWVTCGVGRIFPREWERFAAAVPSELRHLPLVDAYAALLFDPTQRRSRTRGTGMVRVGRRSCLARSGPSPEPPLRRRRVSPRVRALGDALLAPCRVSRRRPAPSRCTGLERHPRRADPRPLRRQRTVGDGVAVVPALDHEQAQRHRCRSRRQRRLFRGRNRRARDG